MAEIEFEAWPKIPRLNRDIVVTEKIDGTNAAIIVVPVTNHAEMPGPLLREGGDFEKGFWHVDNGHGFAVVGAKEHGVLIVGAQSRNKLIYPGGSTDNAGFAGWVKNNALALAVALGPGRHFGEWWGPGIQRRYDEEFKRFSLFNVHRYADIGDGHALHLPDDTRVDTVPVLYQGPFSQAAILDCLDDLDQTGSVASPGFMQPEGVVVYHTAARQTFKVLLEGDNLPKGVQS